jgi:hypothetical protein
MVDGPAVNQNTRGLSPLTPRIHRIGAKLPLERGSELSSLPTNLGTAFRDRNHTRHSDFIL